MAKINQITGIKITSNNISGVINHNVSGVISQSRQSYWKPQIPTGLTATIISDVRIDLAWTNVDTEGDGVSIERSSDGVTYNELLKVALGVTAYSNTGLTIDVIYYYRIRAYKGSKYSGYCNATIVGANWFAPAIVSSDSFGWYKLNDLLTITKDGSNNLTALKDKLGTGHDFVNYNGTILWGADGTILFNGSNSELDTGEVQLVFPVYVYMLIKPLTWVSWATIIASITNAKMRFMQFAYYPNIYVYSDYLTPGDVNLTVGNWAVVRILVNGVDASKIQVDNNTATIGSIDNSTHALNGLVLGAIKALSGFCNFYLKELLVRLTTDVANETDIYNYFNRLKLGTFNTTERFTDSFDNSITYTVQTGYNQRSSFSEYSFKTNATQILVRANVETSAWPYITVYEDDVYKQTVQFTGWGYQVITLSAGNKKVTLVESFCVAGTLHGCFITHIVVPNYIKIPEGTISEKIVMLGDSIGNGAWATIPAKESFIRLFKTNDNKSVASLGWGGASIGIFASDAGKIATTVGWITSLFTNTTTTKKLIIEGSINDLFTAAYIFEAYYGNLLDAIHAADSTIKIYCLSPVYANASEGVTLDAYRTSIGTLCAARSSYCTHIAGKTICTFPGDYCVDGVHPNTAGHLKIYNALKAVMYP